MAKRMVEQDIAKGMTMINIIFLHSLTLFSAGGRDMQADTGFAMIYLCMFCFNMPFFLFMSGYNYKVRPGTYWESIKKRLNRLLKPAFLWSILVWIVLGTYLVIRKETNVPHLFSSFAGYWLEEPLSSAIGVDASRTLVSQAYGPTWFVKYMITASPIFLALAPYVLTDNKKFFSAVAGLLLITMTLVSLGIHLPWGIVEAPAVAAILLLGAIFGSNRVFNGEYSHKAWGYVNFIIAIFIGIFIQIQLPRAGMLSGGRINMVCGPWETIITASISIVGSFIYLAASRVLFKIPLLGKYLSWFGQNTLEALFLHGVFIRIFSDLFGITGHAPSEIKIKTIALSFLCTLVCISLVLLAKNCIKEKIDAKKAAQAA